MLRQQGIHSFIDEGSILKSLDSWARNFGAVWAARTIMLAAIFMVGCQPEQPPKLKSVHVSGRITLDGEPLLKGRVFFFPVRCWNDQGGYLPPSDAMVDDQGKFQLATNHEEPNLNGLPGAVAGWHHVVICVDQSANAVKGKRATMAENDPNEHVRGDGQEGAAKGKGAQAVPDRYNVASQLMFEVPLDGTDCADFDLESDAQ